MAEYIVNQVGSTTMTLPPKISKNDTLVFNVTNKDIGTKYNGTMLTYTFPFDCGVKFEVAGARGGKGNQCINEQEVGKGALLKGDFTFQEGDTLLICVGGAGTDFNGIFSDGTTGAGGGGTFIVKKSTDGTGDTYSGTGVGNGWKVKPLVVSAGGNGGRDIGYSGSGTVYHGLATTENNRTLSSYSGGGYYDQYNDTKSGKAFLKGGLGATYSYTRGDMSYSGFGGGGGNVDDGDGGGGGGWYGGARTISACSYISSEATNIERISGHNFGEGYFKITFLKTPSINARCKINGVIKNVSSMKIKVNGVWKEVSGLKSKINGIWN